MEESIHKAAEHKPWEWHESIAGIKAVIPGLHLLQPSAFKEAEGITGKAEGLLMFFLMHVQFNWNNLDIYKFVPAKSPYLKSLISVSVSKLDNVEII